MVCEIGRSHGLEEGLGQIQKGSSPAAQKKASPSMAVDDPAQFFGHVVKGRVPGDPFPLSASPESLAYHGSLGPFLLIVKGEAGGAFATQGLP